MRLRLDRPLPTLSGGEAARISLAALLLTRFDVLCLDEPTNDLDFDGLERLEQFETEPEYLAFSTPSYALGVGFERLVNRFDALRNLRVNLLAVGRKR